MKKLFIIHTSLVSHQELNDVVKKNYPDLVVQNIIDDSLLKEVSTVGAITPGIVSRMTDYFRIAQAQGADLILNQCSSVGEAAEIAAKTIDIPVVRIDAAMAKKAVSLGKKIVVVATVKSTVEPSLNIVKRAAQTTGEAIEVDSCLIDGALDLLMQGQREKHNQLVLEQLLVLEKEYDVIVLAQGSMNALLPFLGQVKVPVLTSPLLGVESLKDYL